MRGETIAAAVSCKVMPFQSTPLMRGETKTQTGIGHALDFTPLPSCEGRPDRCADGRRLSKFQSTPLMRGETVVLVDLSLKLLFQSTPLMRGETLSIIVPSPLSVHFNPLPSCEGRQHWRKLANLSQRFQSTPLMRGETIWTKKSRARRAISIHSPHARGDRRQRRAFNRRPISIHSPHARGDQQKAPTPRRATHFNPLPSCEGRQHKPLKIRLDSRQSIQQNHHSSFF